MQLRPSADLVEF